jgi:DNA-binding MarR family transcriptional regulator
MMQKYNMTDYQNIIETHKALSNLKRVQMLEYIKTNNMAVPGSFIRILGYKKSFVSKSLKQLFKCNLVLKEHIECTSITVYVVNPKKLHLWYVVAG